jgi:hypothetical protein
VAKSKSKKAGAVPAEFAMPEAVFVGAEQSEYRRFNAARTPEAALPADASGLVAEYRLARVVRVSRRTDVGPAE